MNNATTSDSNAWRINGFVDIGSLRHLRITAACHDPRVTTYALINDAGETFRYVTGQIEPSHTGQTKKQTYRLVDMELPYFH
jgi:hypothetical protein